MSLAILLLTGLVFGRLMKLVKMPNVTGYLIGGLIVGPSVLNLVHADALSQLGFISSVALGSSSPFQSAVNSKPAISNASA